MEEKKIRMRELTEEDMVGIKSDKNRFMIDFLKNVTKRAAEIYDNEALSGESYAKKENRDEKPSSSKRIMFPRKENGEEENEKDEKFRACKNKIRFSFDEEISWDEFQFKKPTNSKEERSRKNKKLKSIAPEEIVYSLEEDFARRNNLDNSTVDIPETSGVKSRKNNKSKRRCNGGEEEEVRVVKKRINTGPDPPPPLPEEFKDAIQELANGRSISQEILVVQKGLYKSDTEPQQSRLSIPLNSVVGEFLKDEEKAHLLKRFNGKLEHISVPIIDPLLIRDKVDLRRWPMKKSNGKESVSYMLTGNWIDMLNRNDLKVGHVVQLWSVRIEEELVFCLVRLPGN
ncbi:uncharacterized protein LOC111409593 [Olea europaea var. sylvestris]|uniref:uncharacterized protein LOC111409593 n=1 Tax=Olea europaea var. sylvestris TaxID=158386 RepID=UPI000C1D0B0D|nr:uncharacterized protein LOC111409593 [Olea europaea var. sylvestris]